MWVLVVLVLGVGCRWWIFSVVFLVMLVDFFECYEVSYCCYYVVDFRVVFFDDDVVDLFEVECV